MGKIKRYNVFKSGMLLAAIITLSFLIGIKTYAYYNACYDFVSLGYDKKLGIEIIKDNETGFEYIINYNGGICRRDDK